MDDSPKDLKIAGLPGPNEAQGGQKYEKSSDKSQVGGGGPVIELATDRFISSGYDS